LDIQPGTSSYVRILYGANMMASFNAGEGSALAVYRGSGSTHPFSVYSSADSSSLALRVDASGNTAVSGSLTLAADPSSALHAATKQYVDSVATGLDVKASVRAVATSNITLSGAQTIDGVSVVAGDRVLVAGQSTGSQNGIYVAASGAWTRAGDADVSAEVTSGMFTFVAEGTTYAGNGFVLTTADPITLGTTALTFTQFSGAGQITAGSGLSKTGNTLSVATGGVTNAMLAGSIAASKLVGTDITTVGTITTGTWSATTIAVAKGGTGVTTSTGTGNVVLSASPTLTGTALTAALTASGEITMSTSTNDAGFTLKGATTGVSPTIKLADSTGAIKIRVGIAGGSNNLTPGSAANDLVIRGESQNILFTVDSGGSTLLKLSANAITLADSANLVFNATTGTKIGTATSQKFSFWNAAPIVQPTTGIAAATFVANTSAIANDTATFDGYTIGQVVKALRNIGALA
jgi:hypothetical protein